MSLVNLRDYSGTGVVSIPKGYLEMDGLIDEEGNVKRQRMLVVREGPGDYRIRPVNHPDVNAQVERD